MVGYIMKEGTHSSSRSFFRLLMVGYNLVCWLNLWLSPSSIRKPMLSSTVWVRSFCHYIRVPPPTVSLCICYRYPFEPTAPSSHLTKLLCGSKNTLYVWYIGTYSKVTSQNRFSHESLKSLFKFLVFSFLPLSLKINSVLKVSKK